jgi:hypothetical protein
LISKEHLQKGAEVFFYLLENKIVPLADARAYLYMEDPEIREVVRNMAQGAGLRVFTTRENIHIVSQAYDSIFATSYTHMKGKYSLHRKRHFYLANIIICVYLSEIDKESDIRVRWEEEGVTYYKLEELVTNILDSWKKRQEDENTFAEEWAIAIDEIYDIWSNDFSMYKESKNGEIDVQRNKNTRLGFIYEAMRPLADQGLIINNVNELKIIPKVELYERLNFLYHQQERYEEIMSLIQKTKEEAIDAEDDSNQNNGL